MKLFVFMLLIYNTWVFGDVIDEQVDALKAHMQKALDVQNLNEENIQKKMKEISDSLSDADLNQLDNPINEPPEGVSEEEFQKMKTFVGNTLTDNNITKEDIDQLKREISDLTQSE